MMSRWRKGGFATVLLVSLTLNIFMIFLIFNSPYLDPVGSARKEQQQQLGLPEGDNRRDGRGLGEIRKALPTEMGRAHLKPVLLDVKQRQEARQRNLLQACSDLEFEERPSNTRTFTKTELSTLKHTIAEDVHKILYCYLPKNSCTNWKRLFLVSSGFAKSVDDIKNTHEVALAAFRSLNQIPADEANRKLREYTHFMFVRSPFSRLLSAYREKIESKSPESNHFTQYVTKWMRKTDPEYLKLRNMSQGYSFPEFVRYVIKRRVDNEHWNDQYQLCSPCLVKYDFIGKYETLLDDADEFLRTSVNDSNLRFPAPQKRPTHSSSDILMARYYRQVPDHDLFSLIDAMYPDLRLFGYSIPDYIRRPGLHLERKHLQLVDVG